MREKGFSLIQILIIVIIIALAVTIVILIFRPSEVLEKSRDSQRFTDINSLGKALNQYLADNRNFNELKGPYSSIDAGFQSDALREKFDGSGWIPLDFTAVSTLLPIEKLPLDPLNNTEHNYRFGVSPANKTYEIESVFEYPTNISKHANDGGNNPNAYEFGTDLTIL